MTKQEFLDKEPQNDTEKVIQLLLTFTSKTKVEQIRRALNELDTILYKSWMKELTLGQLIHCLENASKYNIQKED